MQSNDFLFPSFLFPSSHRIQRTHTILLYPPHTQLKLLHLAGNKLEVLPAVVSKLVLLERLYLNNNAIAVLPGSALKQLVLLTHLNLNSNQLTELPNVRV